MYTQYTERLSYEDLSVYLQVCVSGNMVKWDNDYNLYTHR